MNPTITTDDYQSGALFGSSPNTSAMNAQSLNPAAAGPNDYTSVLTNGICNAALAGVNSASQSNSLVQSVTPAASASSFSGYLPLIAVVVVGYLVFK